MAKQLNPPYTQVQKAIIFKEILLTVIEQYEHEKKERVNKREILNMPFEDQEKFLKLHFLLKLDSLNRENSPVSQSQKGNLRSLFGRLGWIPP